MGRIQYGGRSEQLKAAFERTRDAEALRRAGRWRGAMYLLGYSVECHLKVYLMEKHKARNLEELEKALGRENDATALRTHSLNALLGLTGLAGRVQTGTVREVREAFGICNQWSPEWRYNSSLADEPQCTAFFKAVARFRSFLDGN